MVCVVVLCSWARSVCRNTVSYDQGELLVTLLLEFQIKMIRAGYTSHRHGPSSGSHEERSVLSRTFCFINGSSSARTNVKNCARFNDHERKGSG